MLKNYFKIAWRNLLRNKTTSVINIGGLAIGLAVALIIMTWVTDEMSYDKFHKNLSTIYSVMQNSKQGGDIFTTQSLPAPLAKSIVQEIPEVKYAARVTQPAQQLLSSGEKSLYESGVYADPDYFRIMSFTSLEGNPMAALQNTETIVISESIAKKLFGNEEPLNKVITHNNLRPLTVGAVIKDMPSNSSYHYDVFLPFSLYEQQDNSNLTNWDNSFLYTWIQVHNETNINALNTKLTKLFRNKKNSKEAELFAYPLSELAMHGKFKNGKPASGRFEMLLMMSVLGLFVLIIACINFMNLSTARSERRAREVGVRKSMGASRKSLILQFLIEAFLITILAMFVGIIITKLLLPGFNSLAGKSATLDFANWKIWLALISIVFFTGLFAGSYPAFFLSHFQPVKVLKGAIIDSKGKSLLRKGLVTFQFVISIFLIIITIVINKQVEYGQERSVGYNQDNLIQVPARGDMAGKFDLLRNKLIQIPAVKSVTAGSDNLVSFNASSNGVQWPGKTEDQDFPIAITNVQYDWTKTTGITLAQGRDFSRDYGSDSMACILNMAAVQKMGLKEPVIGTMVDRHKVIGVVNDFVYNNVFASPGPLLVFLHRGEFSNFFIRVEDNGHLKENIASIEQAVKLTNPSYPFEYQMTEEVYDRKFIGIRSGGAFSSMVGGLAILISCLGLFGLSAFFAERRTKEVGIRKVLGATAGKIWFSLSRDFLKPVVLAFFIASPLAAFTMHKMLSNMEYHINLSWWMFVTGGIIVLLVAMFIVSFQAIKAAIANPVKNLRSE